MKRADAIAYMRIAGYHSDTKTHMRLFCENRISKAVADVAYRKGLAQKLAGVKCHCNQCSGAKPPPLTNGETA